MRNTALKQILEELFKLLLSIIIVFLWIELLLHA